MSENVLTKQQMAERAREILENAIYKEAWAKIRDGIITQMSQAPIGDEKAHTTLVLLLQLCNRLQRQFEMMISEGKLVDFNESTKRQYSRS